MTVFTSAGSTIGVSTTAPTTWDDDDEDGYPSLTYTPIGEVTDLGEFGREFALVTHNPVASRGTVKKKGSFNEGSISLGLGLDTDDAGQIIMKAAANSDNDHYFCITTQNGDKYFFAAQVMSFKTNIGSVDSITNATCTLEITTKGAGIGVVVVLDT